MGGILRSSIGDGAIRFGHRLRFVIEIREGVADSFYLLAHHGGAIGRISLSIIGIDGHNSNALLLIFASQFCHSIGHVLHVGAMIADEHHQ